MLIQIPGVLGKDRVASLRRALDAAPWVDGNLTSGYQAALAKKNRQLPQADPVARQAGAEIIAALEKNPLFTSAALPHTILPPLFNRYGISEGFGAHVDNAVRTNIETGKRIRTDLSATLFLSEPDDYDGGELTIEDTYGAHSVKLEAGDLILYPATSLHSVSAITRGERVGAFFWIQSLVRSDVSRALLFDMDVAIQSLSAKVGSDDLAIVSLTGTYHNLLRQWAEL